jgi:hypothetical protein
MERSDVEQLRARIKAALAESAEEHGKVAHPKGAPASYVVPFEATACHLVNHDDTRTILTDPAVLALGGKEFTLALEVKEDRIVVTPKAEEKAPEGEPKAAEPPRKAAHHAKEGESA